MTRRELFIVAGSAALAACGKSSNPVGPSTRSDGRLTARPQADHTVLPYGGWPLDLAVGRDGMMFVPARVPPDRQLPMAVVLHGAYANSSHMEFAFELADGVGLALLMIDSRSITWDAIVGPYGQDVEFIDRALAKMFGVCAVDPARVSILGFSDGATYALALGLVNGDLFSRIVAFSPGSVRDEPHYGRPSVLISHGIIDPVMPISATSRPIVAKLQSQSYDVTYREFYGGHEIPDAIALEAFRWLV